MKYAQFGSTGLVVSRLALGAMTFGQGTLVGELVNDIDEKTADRMVGTALDAGVNFFDTADMYTEGQSEVMLGKALKRKRTEVVIATKCGFRSGEAVISAGLSYRYVLQAVEASLRRLSTDYIDLFLLHIPDPLTPVEETARALQTAMDKGWIRYAGCSNFPAWKAQKLLSCQEKMGFQPLAGAQMYYSLLGRDIEHEWVPFLADSGLGLMVWSPLASGFLTGKYTRKTPVPEGARRAKFDFPPVDVEKGYAVVDQLQSIAESRNASVPQAAIAWLLAKPAVSSVIVGATKIAQLQDNLGAADLELTGEEVAALDEATETPAPYPAWMQPLGEDEKVKRALGG